MKKALIVRGLKLLHSLCVIGLFAVCWYLFYRSTGSKPAYVRYNPLMCGAYIVLHVTLYHIYQSYVIGYNRVFQLVYAQTLADLIGAGIIWVLDMLAWMKWINPLWFFALVAAQFVVNLLWCLLANKIYFKIHKPKKTILIYRNRNDRARIEEVFKFPERFTVEKELEKPANDFKTLFLELEGFEAVFVAGIDASMQNGISKYCVDRGIQGYFAPHVGDIIMMGAEPIRQFSVPVLNTRRAEPAPEYLFLKRVFDIVVSGLGIVVLSPVMLIVAICIKLCDRGPVLYKQVRLTKDGKTFRIWKFRSMRVDAEKDGVARLASDKDDRITPVGHVIRACRLDELPQLFNIFLSDMSIVGPRPERPEIAAQYEEILPAFRLRLQVKAGLTGYAQIYGRYNTDPYDKLQMDLIYINKMSVFEDLKLMFATVAILFQKESTEGVAAGQTTAAARTNNETVPEEDTVRNQ